MGFNERFMKDVPKIPSLTSVFRTVVNQSCTQTSNATDAAVDVTGSRVVLGKGEFKPGMTFRVSLGGTKSGTNGTMAVYLKLGATQVMTLTSDETTEVDWYAQFLISAYTDFAHQKVLGRLNTLTTDPVVDYAAGTVNTSQGAALVAQILPTSGDTVTVEYCLVEHWKW